LTAEQNDQGIWVHCDTLFTPYQRRRNWLLQVQQGKIRRMIPASEMKDIPPERLIHKPDAIVAPGFIDLHIHGAAGHDFMEGTAASLQAAAATLARHGTTAFLATTVSAPDDQIETALRNLAAHRSSISQGARAIGIHLEGPYLNPLRRGTHVPGFLRPADLRSFRRFVEVSDRSIRRLTIAPEMDPGLELIREAAALGIQVSLGHTDATEEQARAAADAGAAHTTHTFNAMRPMHQREPGILGVALTDDRIYTEVIADGVHLHPTTLQLIYRVKGVDRAPLVTDGLSAVGMPDGSYTLGGRTIAVKHGECRDQDGHLAGSTLTLDRAVRNLVEWLDIPLHEALTAATATPARCMRMGDNKGIISPGADADLVFLNRDLQVVQTMVAGRVVYSRPPTSDLRHPTPDIQPQ
jgi:N-acetylglucosamine-6-phosphate deacetylase